MKTKIAEMIIRFRQKPVVKNKLYKRLLNSNCYCASLMYTETANETKN